MTNIRITERDVQASILEYLQIKKIFVWRNNSGMIFGTNTKGKSYAHRMGPKGSSDIIGLLPDGKFLAIEVKKPGGKTSEVQDEFIQKILDQRGIAFVATCIDDVHVNLARYL